MVGEFGQNCDQYTKSAQDDDMMIDIKHYNCHFHMT